MALFGVGKKEDKEKEAAAPAAGAAIEKVTKSAEQKSRDKVRGAKRVEGHDLTGILVRPRITEKAATVTERGAYIFDVHPSATKTQIAEAIRARYSVVPRKVNVAVVPAKQIRSRLRGRFGVVSSGKKAYVYLKEGDSIETV